MPLHHEIENVRIANYSVGGSPDGTSNTVMLGEVVQPSPASGHTGGANFAMGDGSVRFLHADAGYSNPLSFQIISAGKGAVQDDGLLPPAVQDDGLLLPAVQDNGLLLPAVQDDAVTFTAIAMAESGGNAEPHTPHGEDSRGLWQINVDPAQTDNPDTFDCSELTQWATAREGGVPNGDWITDLTYQSVEVLGQPATETIDIAHAGLLWV